MSPVLFTPNVQRLRDRLMEVTNMRYSYVSNNRYILARDFWCFIVFEVAMGVMVGLNRLSSSDARCGS
jgi:hypothetical protein